MTDIKPSLILVALCNESDSPPAWQADLMAHLSQHYTLQIIYYPDEPLPAPLPEHVLLVGDETGQLRFAQHYHQRTQQNHPAILIAICPDYPQNALPRWVNTIIPPIPSYIDHALRQPTPQKSKDEISLLKSAIVRNVSHELRTPLLQVKSAISLLAEDTPNPKLAEYATDATARLEALVKNITQLANNMDAMSAVPIIIRETVDYAILNLRRAWEHKQEIARVQVNIEPNLPLALGDKQGISTVIQLLIDNALKFSTDSVLITAQHQDKSILVSVEDKGIGIATDKLDNIFDAFYQVDSSSTRRYGGIGVGLAIVQLILDWHHTQIRVESQKEQGSKFSFELPIAQISS
jgi:signal transduction histidine kinase